MAGLHRLLPLLLLLHACMDVQLWQLVAMQLIMPSCNDNAGVLR
jgi:hypothetical protein